MDRDEQETDTTELCFGEIHRCCLPAPLDLLCPATLYERHMTAHRQLTAESYSCVTFRTRRKLRNPFLLMMKNESEKAYFKSLRWFSGCINEAQMGSP